MISVLAARFAGAPRALTDAHPHPWLVWEPGAWHAPRKDFATVVINTARRIDPVAGEALALALQVSDGGELLLGRSTDCDLSINDATLSGRHLILSLRNGAYALRDVGSRNGTAVDGARLTPGIPVTLREGARIEAADVLFTFHTPEGLAARLQRMLAGVR